MSKETDAERMKRVFAEAEEYHLQHALRLIDRTPYDQLVGRVDRRVRDGVTTYTFLGDPILEVRYSEGVTPANPKDNYPIETYDKTLHFKHLKGDPPTTPFRPSDGPFMPSSSRKRRSSTARGSELRGDHLEDGVADPAAESEE